MMGLSEWKTPKVFQGVDFGFGINDRLLTPLSQGGLHDEVIAGTCEEWTVVSDPPGVGHAFHIHTNPYLVTHEDGIAFKKPFWRDTYTIRGSNITIKTCFNHLKPGDYVLVHCHQLTHQDIGVRSCFIACVIPLLVLLCVLSPTYQSVSQMPLKMGTYFNESTTVQKLRCSCRLLLIRKIHP